MLDSVIESLHHSSVSSGIEQHVQSVRPMMTKTSHLSHLTNCRSNTQSNTVEHPETEEFSTQDFVATDGTSDHLLEVESELHGNDL